MKEKINELIHIYISALEKIENAAHDELVVMMEKIMECKSYIVLSGIGKSAIIAKKYHRR